MKSEKIDHIGIAVESIDDLIPHYRDTLGMTYVGSEEVSGQKVRVAFFEIGESRIELLEPTSDESPIATFLAKTGSGMHHIAIRVNDIDGAIEDLIAAETRMVDKEARLGAHNTRIAFIHPKSTGGVLLELCEHPE
ncbi:MAG: methylmalonyl-CoA epimerase [Candidatus Thorarchaeota archaeon]|nr:methylmalonyl-CoA epimerase [Candidatus Thorarchaeota archaeon]